MFVCVMCFYKQLTLTDDSRPLSSTLTKLPVTLSFLLSLLLSFSQSHLFSTERDVLLFSLTAMTSKSVERSETT